MLARATIVTDVTGRNCSSVAVAWSQWLSLFIVLKCSSMLFRLLSCFLDQAAVEMLLRIGNRVFFPLTLLAFAASAFPLAERATMLDDVSQVESAYDYVIIGGGTSGLTVAERLTESSTSPSPPTI